MLLDGGIRRTGRKMRPGSITFSKAGRVCVFVDYCPDCHKKLMLDVRSAQEFAGKLTHRTSPIQAKVLIKLLNKVTI